MGKGGRDEIGEMKKNKTKKKRSHSEERGEDEAGLKGEEGEGGKREERVCKRKEDGMLEVKVENKKPVGMLLEERLVDDERLGKKMVKSLLFGRDEKQDMKERLGPMPRRTSKRKW